MMKLAWRAAYEKRGVVALVCGLALPWLPIPGPRVWINVAAFLLILFYVMTSARQAKAQGVNEGKLAMLHDLRSHYLLRADASDAEWAEFFARTGWQPPI